MGLLVRCPACGREVDSTRLRAGRCRRCRLEDATATERSELDRLLSKQARYQRSGTSTAALAQQMDRVERRLAERVRAVLGPAESLSDALRELAGAGDDDGGTDDRQSAAGILLP